MRHVIIALFLLLPVKALEVEPDEIIQDLVL